MKSEYAQLPSHDPSVDQVAACQGPAAILSAALNMCKQSFTQKSVDVGANQPSLQQASHGPRTFMHSTTLPGRISAPRAHFKQDAADEGVLIDPWVILPRDPAYVAWWCVTVAAAVVTAFWEPLMFAFKEHPGLYPYLGPAAVLEYALVAIFLADMAVSMFVAYQDTQRQLLITHLEQIRANYLRGRFWLDLLGALPWEAVAMAIAGVESDSDADGMTASLLGILRWLKLVRCYRIVSAWSVLEYDLRVGQLLITLVRNQMYLLLLVHVAACCFYFIARQFRFSDDSWLGHSYNSICDKPLAQQYVFALYWSMTTFATVGYGDLHPVNVAEALFTFLYAFCNVAFGAYIIATISVLVVRKDERTKEFRAAMDNLRQFCDQHSVPKELEVAAQEHLELHLNCHEVSDEQVLSVYPATIRRRMLRHLHAATLRRCSLFRGVSNKFMDALLHAARVEMFMPKVDVVCEGDHVHELYILLTGAAEVLNTSSASSGTGPLSAAPSMPPAEAPAAAGPAAGWPPSVLAVDCTAAGSGCNSANNTRRGSRRRLVLPGETFGDVAFFTHVPVTEEAVRTLDVCRVLVIPKSGWEGLTRDFMLSARTVLANLQARCEQEVMSELRGLTASSANPSARPSAAAATAAAPPSGAGSPLAAAAALSAAPTAALSATATAALSAELSAASGAPAAAGSAEALSAVYQLLYRHGAVEQLEVGHDRSHASHLAGLSSHQRQAVSDLMRVRALIAAHTERLNEVRVHEFLFAASRGDEERVRQMLLQGHAVDAPDYDERTALMLASARGHRRLVALLLEAGADARRRDALGSNACLEACKAGHDEVLGVLTAAGVRLGLDDATVAGLLCRCCSEGNVPLLRRLLRAGANPDAADYDGRRALHIAAADGFMAAAKVLVEEGGADLGVQDRFGRTPAEEAGRTGATHVAEYLQQQRLAQQQRKELKQEQQQAQGQQQDQEGAADGVQRSGSISGGWSIWGRGRT